MEDLEIWKDVVGYEGLYQVSTFGRVKSLNRVITCKNKTFITKKGVYKSFTVNEKNYFKVSLSKNNKSKFYKVHRLVALHFILNFNNKKEVNHIDGDKHNNHYLNLEWSTRLENMQHALKAGLLENCKRFGVDNNKSRKVINNKTKIIYNSVKEASISIDIKPATLQAMLSGSNPNKTDMSYLDELVVNQKFN